MSKKKTKVPTSASASASFGGSFISFSDVTGDASSLSTSTSLTTSSFSGSKPGIAATAGLAPLYTGDDPALGTACKKLVKKDIVTKSKGLDELCKLIDSKSSEFDVSAFLPHYCYLFIRLALDTNAQIRVGLCQSLLKLVTVDKRAFGPFMKTLIGYWWVLCEDDCADVASTATASFEAAIPPKKRPDVLLHLSGDLVNTLTANISSKPEDLSDTSHCTPEEVQERFELVVTATLRAVGRLVCHVPPDSIFAALGLSEAELSAGRTAKTPATLLDLLWNKTKHKKASFRQASYRSLQMFFQSLPSREIVHQFVLSHSDRVLGILDERADDSIESMMALLVSALRHTPQLWSKIGVETMVARLANLLASASSQSTSQVLSILERVVPQLSLVVGSIPAELISVRKSASGIEHQAVLQARTLLVQNLIGKVLSMLPVLEEEMSLLSFSAEKCTDRAASTKALACNLATRVSVLEMSTILLLRRVPVLAVSSGNDEASESLANSTEIHSATLTLFSHLITESTVLVQFLARYCSSPQSLEADPFYIHQSNSETSPSERLLQMLQSSGASGSPAPIVAACKSLTGVMVQLNKATQQAINYTSDEWATYLWDPFVTELLASETMTSYGSSDISVSADNGLVTVLSAILASDGTQAYIDSIGLQAVTGQISANVTERLDHAITNQPTKYILAHIRLLLSINPIKTTPNSQTVTSILEGLTVPLIQRLVMDYSGRSFCCFRHDHLSCEIGAIISTLARIQIHAATTSLDSNSNTMFTNVTDMFVQHVVNTGSIDLLDLIEYQLSNQEQSKGSLTSLFNETQLSILSTWREKVCEGAMSFIEGSGAIDLSLSWLNRLKSSELIRLIVSRCEHSTQVAITQTYFNRALSVFRKLQNISIETNRYPARQACILCVSLAFPFCSNRGYDEGNLLLISSSDLTALVCYLFFSQESGAQTITSTLSSSICVQARNSAISWPEVLNRVIPSLSAEEFSATVKDIGDILGDKSVVNKFSLKAYSELVPRALSLISTYYSHSNQAPSDSFLTLLESIGVYSTNVSDDPMLGDSPLRSMLQDWSNSVLRGEEAEIKEILDVVGMNGHHDTWTRLVYQLHSWENIFSSETESNHLKTTVKCLGDVSTLTLNLIAEFIFRFKACLEKFASELRTFTTRPILGKLLAHKMAMDGHDLVDCDSVATLVSKIAAELEATVELCQSVFNSVLKFITTLGFNERDMFHCLTQFSQIDLVSSNIMFVQQGLAQHDSTKLAASLDFIDTMVSQKLGSRRSAVESTTEIRVIDSPGHALDQFALSRGMTVWYIDVDHGTATLCEGEIVGVHSEAGDEPYYSVQLQPIKGSDSGTSDATKEVQTDACKLITFRDENLPGTVELYVWPLEFVSANVLSSVSEGQALGQLYVLKVSECAFSILNKLSAILLQEPSTSRRAPTLVNPAAVDSLCMLVDRACANFLSDKKSPIVIGLLADIQRFVSVSLDILMLNRNIEHLNMFICTLKLFKVTCMNIDYSTDSGFTTRMLLNLAKVKSFVSYLAGVSKLVLPAPGRLIYITELCSLCDVLFQSVKSHFVHSFSLKVVELALKTLSMLEQVDTETANATEINSVTNLSRALHQLFSCVETLQMHCSTRVLESMASATAPKKKVSSADATSVAPQKSNFNGFDIELFMLLLQHFACDPLTSSVASAAANDDAMLSSHSLQTGRSLVSADAILASEVRDRVAQCLHLFLLGRDRQAVVELAVKSSLGTYKDALLLIACSSGNEDDWTRIVACKLLDVLFASGVDTPDISTLTLEETGTDAELKGGVDAEKEEEDIDEAAEIEKDRRLFTLIVGETLITQLYARLPQVCADGNIKRHYLSSHASANSLSRAGSILDEASEGDNGADIDIPISLKRSSFEPNSNACEKGDLLGLTLLWLLILQRIEATARVHMGAGSSCSAQLKRSGLFADMTSVLMRQISAAGDGVKSLSNAFQRFSMSGTKENLTVGEVGIKTLCTYALFRSACYFPSLTRQHWSDNCSRADKERLRNFIEERVYRALVAKEIALIALASRSSIWNPEELSVRGSVASGEVIATYIKEDAKVEIKITLPPEYPLKNVEVEYISKLGVSEERLRRWKLQIIHLLKEQDGAVIDAILLWKRNVEKEFEGVEPCPICYNVLDIKTNSLPTLQCSVCSNRFHKQCLNTWFRQSGKNKCVLCQQPFHPVAPGSSHTNSNSNSGTQA